MGTLNLSPGTWFFVRHLPADATSDELIQFFWDCGISIEFDSVSFCDDKNGDTAAVISVSKSQILQLVRWAVDQKKFRDEQLQIELFGSDRKSKILT